MKAFLLIITLALIQPYSHAQIPQDLSDINPHQPYDNILIRPLTSDSLSSSFVIWIKDAVKPHKHLHHVEQVYVLEGEGIMSIGNSSFDIKPGVYISIPKNTAHHVNVSSEIPLKVLSIQSPRFEGKDRVYVE